MTATSPSATPPALPATRRWLPRFGLRTLLILVALFGAGFGYLGHLYRRVAHQRYIVAKIQEAGGTVRYNWELGMGDYLQPMTDTDELVTKFEELPGGMQKMTRVTRNETRVQTEKLPGPWILRALVGNDAFAYVEAVDFQRSSHPAKPFDPRLLLELPHLKVIGPVDRQVSDEWLNCIAQIPLLRVLNLSGNSDASATAKGLSLLQSAKNLEALHVSGEWLTGEVFSGVAKLTQLKSLEIALAPRVNSAIFTHIGQLTQLEELSIVRCKQINDAGTEPLQRLQSLRVLQLADVPIGNSTLNRIDAPEKLENIVVIQANVSDEGVRSLARFSKLKLISLRWTNVGDVGIQAIAELPDLRKLDLGSTKVTDACLPAIGRLTRLESLDLWKCDVTDDGLSHLRTLTKLNRLDLGLGATKEAAERLQESLPACTITGGDGADSFYLIPHRL